ncbi:hypothetical protein HAX54_017197 [Datura stramonium]|uniref:Chalcone-flavonone isomerase family protein n=1 Tax=Datura stramonium TaxID=4076 RepID=A0ABS8S2M4_DATST|nr:hypothetical protein [Datura stramonium]
MASVSQLQVDNYVFPPTVVKPPGSNNTLFLAGAGHRGLEIEGKFVKFTAIGVYFEESAVSFLATKWKGKSSDELTHSVEFFRDIITGPFEKFTRVTMILPLTGKQYSEKVAENCVAHWKAIGTYRDVESEAIEKFLNVFQSETFPPGASILFTHSPLGSLTISFSKDDSVTGTGNTVIENKQLSEALLESIIGKHGVSPAAKCSLAERVSELLEKSNAGASVCEKPGSNQSSIQVHIKGNHNCEATTCSEKVSGIDPEKNQLLVLEPEAYTCDDEVFKKAEAMGKRLIEIYTKERWFYFLNRLVLLKLHCWGCDGSVLLDDTITLKGEKNAPNNKNALKGFRIIDRIKNRIESECPGTVSCADILTIAARDAVLLVGGPYWDVPLGRKDSKTAGYELTDTNLPTADEGLISIISKFISQGLSVTDMVALSGAHTIGKARCVNFRNRIYGDFKMTSTSMINPISSSYLNKLKSLCPPISEPSSSSDNNETSMDNVTPNLFDNSYYHVLLKGEGLINSDQELYSSFLGIQTKKIVEKYAANTIAFFEQFAESMVKMGNITNPETYVNGEVRKSCRFVNT